MRHLYRLFGFLPFLAVFLSLSCNQSDESVELKFWAIGAEAEYVVKLIPEFEKRNPGIKVSVQAIPWTAAQEKLITAFAGNNTPDLCQLGNTWVPQFASLNAIEPLDSFITVNSPASRESFFPGILETNVIDGTLFGIPWYIDTRCLYYRKDILEKAGYPEPPKTWKELLDVSQKIKRNAGDHKKFAIYLPTNEFAPFVIFGLQAGASLLKENNTLGNFSAPEFKTAFTFLTDFHKQQWAPIGISEVTNIYQGMADEFVAMYISGPWNIPEFKKWMKGKLQDTWMTAPLPAKDSSYPGVSLAGGSSLVIFKSSKKKEAAWKFIEYLSETQTQLSFYRLLNDLPSVKAAWEVSGLKDDKYMKAFYTQFLHVVPTPKIPEWEQIAFYKIQQYAEYAARGAMTVDHALEALDDDVNTILEKRRWLMNRQVQ